MKPEGVQVGMRVRILPVGDHVHAGKAGRVVEAARTPRGRTVVFVELDTGGKVLFLPDELEPEKAEVEQP